MLAPSTASTATDSPHSQAVLVLHNVPAERAERVLLGDLLLGDVLLEHAGCAAPLVRGGFAARFDFLSLASAALMLLPQAVAADCCCCFTCLCFTREAAVSKEGPVQSFLQLLNICLGNGPDSGLVLPASWVS